MTNVALGSSRLSRRLALGGGAAILAGLALPAKAIPPVAARNEVPLAADLRARTGIGSVAFDQEGNGSLFDAAHQPRGSFSTNLISDNHAVVTLSAVGARPATLDFTVTTAGDKVTLAGALNGQRVLLVVSRATGGIVGEPVVPAVDPATRSAAQAISQALQAQTLQHKAECLHHLLAAAMCLMNDDNKGAGLSLMGYVACEMG